MGTTSSTSSTTTVTTLQCPNDCMNSDGLGVCDPQTGKCTCAEGAGGDDCGDPPDWYTQGLPRPTTTTPVYHPPLMNDVRPFHYHYAWTTTPFMTTTAQISSSNKGPSTTANA